jgi:hypothetical protein
MNKLSARRNHRIEIFFLVLPFLVAMLIMLPRLLSPQFGFEDDGISLSMASKALAGMRINFDDTNGFFRPIYWLGLIVEYLIGGLNPFWFYFTNLVVLCMIIAEILILIRLRGGSIFQASLSAILFVLSSPIIESFYTNSKPEAQQLMWLAGSLVSGHFLAHPQKAKRYAANITTTAFILFASLNKSTFIALIPVSFGWVVLTWLFLRQDQGERRRSVSYFIASLMATAAYFILRQWTLPIGILQGTYTNDYILNFNFMVFMINHWAIWLSRGYLGFLIGFALLLAFWKKVGPVTRRLALASLVWMMGWFAVYLPWGHALDYYLLPFAFGYAIFCGIIVGSLPDFLHELKISRKIMAVGLSCILGMLVLMSTVTNASNARIQLLMDKENMRLLTYLSENTRPEQVIAVNLNKNATFFRHVSLLMTLVGKRNDLNFIPFQFQQPQSENDKPYLLAMPVIKNQPLVKVRGYSEGQSLVNKSLEAFTYKLKPIYEIGGNAHLLTFNPAILLCPFTQRLPLYSIYCNKPASLLIDSRDYSFGWQVYEINASNHNMSSPAVYLPSGELKLFQQDGSINHISFQSKGNPLAADWNGDGVTDIMFINSAEPSWQVYLAPFDRKPAVISVPGMTSEDIPLAGDWNCDNRATPGYYRPSDGTWHLWNDPAGGDVQTTLTGARPNDVPIVGDWDGDGCDSVGVYRPDKGEVNLENSLTADLSGIDFNAPVGSIPVPADWGGLGLDTLGFFNGGQWSITYANCECPPANGYPVFEFGAPGDFPLSGKW